ncbi:MAG: carboxypeptidase regulatory-like domain-containing protein [Elusimicrobia bacterium]|nr:carboxypeptidase regulatory-like domain-containing protein [Elusimicrobiota bacterium]
MKTNRLGTGFNLGVTLVELMVMSVIASLVALTVIQGFSGISRGIVMNRFKSLASQYANEKMQSLKSTPYYRLRVSSTTVTPTGMGSGVFSPYVYSDTTNYPPTAAVVNGISFTAYTQVERVLKNASTDVLEVKTWNFPDTGIKRITLNVVWRERGKLKRIRISNLLENPDRLAASGDFVGNVRHAVTNANLSGVAVSLSEIPSLATLTTATGYRIGAPAGTYTLRASLNRYFPITVPGQVITSTTSQVTVNMFLTPKSSAPVTGSVWHNDHLVISRICADVLDFGAVNWLEYVEIHNPTTWTWTVDGQIGLAFQRSAPLDPASVPINLNYGVGGNAISPGGFYLFASHPSLNIGGTIVNADAVWENAIGGPNDTNFPYFNSGLSKFDVIGDYNGADPNSGFGVLSLQKLAPAVVLDKVGWEGNGETPASCESAPLPDANGMEQDEVYFRKSSPAGGSSVLGPAYDGGNNALDWAVDSGITYPVPRTTASAPLPVVSGVPSFGARVFANDGMSALVTASSGAWSPPEARFTLPAVATGTWTVSASSGSYYGNVNVTVAAGVPVTTNIVMNTPSLYGFVSGWVLDASTNGGIDGITLTPGPAGTDVTGYFDIPLTAGTKILTANPGSIHPTYTETSQSVTITLGQVLSNVVLSLNPGGKIQGLVTLDGATPLPNVSIEVTNNATGMVMDNTTSDANGYFLVQVPVGYYNVQPATDYGETVSPATPNVFVPSVPGGVTVFSATYTVTSAYGSLGGKVTSLGKSINTGVLVMASTSAVPALPPDIDSTLRGAGNLYYAGSSRADGTYAFNLRSGTYTVTGWFTSFNGDTPAVSRKDVANVVVNPRQKTTVDLAW